MSEVCVVKKIKVEDDEETIKIQPEGLENEYRYYSYNINNNINTRALHHASCRG